MFISKKSINAVRDARKVVLKKDAIIDDDNFALVPYQKIITIEETFDYKSIEDKLAELDYERSIKNNLTNIIINKLITQISRLKWL